MTDQAPELLPCPFCGEKPFERWEDNINGPQYPGHYFVWCENLDCGVGGEAMKETKEAAYKAWNTRPPSERPVALVEENNQLRAEIKTLKRKLATETDRADGFLLAAQVLAGGADHR